MGIQPESPRPAPAKTRTAAEATSTRFAVLTEPPARDRRDGLAINGKYPLDILGAESVGMIG